MKKFALVLSLVMLPGVCLAQDFSTVELEKVFKQDMNRDFEKKEDANGFVYDVKDTLYYIRYNPKGKFLMLFATLKSENPLLEKLNAWNTNAIYSRAYFSNKAIVFECPLNVAAGATRPLVKSYIEGSESELTKFQQFIQQ